MWWAWRRGRSKEKGRWQIGEGWSGVSLGMLLFVSISKIETVNMAV